MYGAVSQSMQFASNFMSSASRYNLKSADMLDGINQQNPIEEEKEEEEHEAEAASFQIHAPPSYLSVPWNTSNAKSAIAASGGTASENPTRATNNGGKSSTTDFSFEEASSERTGQRLSHLGRSAKNPLLNMLSQDDFTKLKKEIHEHIDKMGIGKIEEKPIAEEEEGMQSSSQEKGEVSDDEQVVLESREYLNTKLPTILVEGGPA